MQLGFSFRTWALMVAWVQVYRSREFLIVKSRVHSALEAFKLLLWAIMLDRDRAKALESNTFKLSKLACSVRIFKPVTGST